MKTIQKEEEVWFQLDYLSNLREFLASAYEVKGSDAVLYDDEENMLKKARFFNTLNNYLTWCAVRRYINYASKPFRKVYDDFVKSLSGGKTSDRRWKSCVMTTNTAFGLALTRPFIEKTHIKIEDLNKVHGMVETIKSAFSSRQ